MVRSETSETVSFGELIGNYQGLSSELLRTKIRKVAESIYIRSMHSWCTPLCEACLNKGGHVSNLCKRCEDNYQEEINRIIWLIHGLMESNNAASE